MEELDAAFTCACQTVRSRASSVTTSYSDKKLLYVYYKVATIGTQPLDDAPSNFSPKYAYWRAWNEMGPRLDAVTAKRLYVNLVRKLNS